MNGDYIESERLRAEHYKKALEDILAIVPASVEVEWDYADHDCRRCLDMQKIVREALKYVLVQC